MSNFFEQCWFLVGVKIGPFYIGTLKYHSRGSFARVYFNWEEALSNNLMGFYHTHPGGLPNPSPTDDETMRGWVKSEGKPLLCGIRCCGTQNCYIYQRSKVKRSKIIREKISSILLGNLFIGKRRRFPEMRLVNGKTGSD